jgi:osmotically-inducible protein OsmY
VEELVMCGKFLLLAVVGVGGLAAYNYWSDHGLPLPSNAAVLEETAARQAARVANRATAEANYAARKLGGTMGDSALTAKIKSKMALDDYVDARAIDVDTSNSIVTLTGVVASASERDRALGLARQTAGVTRVVDKLRIKKAGVD